MFKRILIFFLFLMLSAVLWIQGRQLMLNVYVFFPLLVFPAYYFYETRDDAAILVLFGLLTALFLLFFIPAPSWEMVVFGAGHLAFVALVWAYWARWQGAVRAEIARRDAAVSELETLRKKHESRLESLHHLEKQVGGLLDLFEIARDFGECLSFEKMAEILQKKVLPEIRFEHLILWVFEREKDREREMDAPSAEVLFFVGERGVESGSPGQISPERLRRFEEVRANSQMVQSESQWVFPLVVDGRLAACLGVEGAAAEDLAKFEVLSAYLALQVKKVQLYETVRELSIRDSLTGIFVRRHFVERFEEELRRCIRFKLPLAVLMLDIDHFKRYNDDHGHMAGDSTLKQVASILRQSLRKVDLVARYGGEEFVMVIPETRREGAFEVAERIRSGVARHNFKVFHEETRVTVSVGIALYPADVEASEQAVEHAGLAAELIHCADQALYRAKEEGRNRVILFHDL
ncbi:MAG: GGDEF domain-containing protein [Candidatus Omnitrophota bacterium]|jgi:diguanylate cyclase (GGDEF)-like protein